MKQLGKVLMNNIKDATDSPKDWDDFWKSISEEEAEHWKTKSKYYFDYNRNDLNRKNPFKKQ